MIKELNLLEYLPPFMQNYKELQNIFDVEEPKLHDINIQIDKILDNQFISTCDENGILLFENLLNITPNFNDVLQTRITRVLMKFNDFPPYTFKYLINALDALYGCENYQFIEKFDDYFFDINFINNFLPNDINLLNEFIYYIKPANLVYQITSKNIFDFHVFTGNILSGNYKKSVIHFENYFNEVDIFSKSSLGSNYKKSQINFENYNKEVDIFLNNLVGSNYIKEVILFE